MLCSDDVLPDTYRAGRYLRRWVLVDGQPRCLTDAIDTTEAAAGDANAVRAANASVAQRLSAVEAFEASVTLVARVEAMAPPLTQTRPVYGLDGTASEEPNPAWADYQAAKTTVAGASDLTKAYALVRRGKPAAPLLGANPSADWLAYQAATATIEAAG